MSAPVETAMNLRPLFFLTFACCAGLLVAAEPSHKLAEVNELPKGLQAKVAAELNPRGYRVVGPDGPVAEIWLARTVEVKPGFKPTLNVKYPFTPGQFVGLLRVPEGSAFTDFRGQEIQPGVYTLRYGQQPQDGNHIGTSELADFLLALPAAADTDLKPITDFDALSQKSADAAASTHPAILSLLPSERNDAKAAALDHNEERDYWIVELKLSGTAKGEKVEVPLRLVVIGRSEV
jgi:hypothetical protein